MAQETRRYDTLAEQYSQYRPRYPDQLISHLACSATIWMEKQRQSGWESGVAALA